MTTIIVAVVAVVATLLIAVPITSKVSVDNKVKKDAETIGSAEEKARGIIDEALKTAMSGSAIKHSSATERARTVSPKLFRNRRIL